MENAIAGVILVLFVYVGTSSTIQTKIKGEHILPLKRPREERRPNKLIGKLTGGARRAGGKT